jgi:hypothetical protein
MSLVSSKPPKVEYIAAAPSREQPTSIFIDEQKRVQDTLRADRDHKQWHFVNLRGVDRELMIARNVKNFAETICESSQPQPVGPKHIGMHFRSGANARGYEPPRATLVTES